jgi:hypothetical protein
VLEGSVGWFCWIYLLCCSVLFLELLVDKVRCLPASWGLHWPKYSNWAAQSTSRVMGKQVYVSGSWNSGQQDLKMVLDSMNLGRGGHT